MTDAEKLNKIEAQVDKIRYAMYPSIERESVKDLLEMFDADSGEFKDETQN